MSDILADYHDSLRKTELAAVELFRAELMLDGKASSVKAVNKAEEALAAAARDLAQAVDRLPRQRQPKGWIKPVTPGALVNPDTCGSGDCGSCDGAPCECPCHETGGAA